MTDAVTHGNVIGRRVLAFLVDAFVVAGVVFPVARRGTRSRLRATLATAIGSGLVGLPYHVLLEGTFGRTVGKRLLGIAVRRENGDRCTLTAAGVRTVLRLVDWLPAGYLVAFVSIAASDRDQRIGDRFAGTVVTRSQDARTVAARSDDVRTDDTRTGDAETERTRGTRRP